MTFRLLLVDIVGGGIGLVWLAALRQWWDIAAGLAGVLAAVVAFPIASLPAIGFALLAAGCAERDQRLGAASFAFLSHLWTGLLAVAWCWFVASECIDAIDADDRIPLLCWGGAVALLPLSRLAYREDSYTALQAALGHVFFLALVVCWAVAAPAPAALLCMAAMLLLFPTLALIRGLAP